MPTSRVRCCLSLSLSRRRARGSLSLRLPRGNSTLNCYFPHFWKCLGVGVYRLQDVAKSVRCKASSRVIAFVRWPADIKTRTTSVHCTRTGSTSLKPRTTSVQRTRNGVHTSQCKDYPRVSALRGPRKSKHGLPTWSASNGVYTSPSTDYSRKQRIHWPIK